VGVACLHLGQNNAEARNSWNWSGGCPGAGERGGCPARGTAPGAAPCFIGPLPGAGPFVGRRL